MPDFVTKRGDTLPSLPFTFTGGSGRSLAGATVNLIVTTLAGVVKTDSACVVEDAAARSGRYDFVSQDLDTVGDFEFEFEVTYSDGKVETFPKDRKMTMRVKADLG